VEANLLNGSIPPDWFANLPRNLTLLYFSRNTITGPLPPTRSLPDTLSAFFAHSNPLTGTISSDWPSSLVTLNLYNTSLSGTLPLGLALDKLRSLALYSSNFSGTLPNWNLPSLTEAKLHDNQLTGNAADVAVWPRC
jgi:hypothetical protein